MTDYKKRRKIGSEVESKFDNLDIRSVISEAIVNKMTERGINKTELGSMIGHSDNTVFRIINGKK